MAPPGDCFRAHDGRMLQSTLDHQLVQGAPELVRLHVVGVAAKACVSPAHVDGILLGLAQSTETACLPIVNGRTGQALRQRLGVELRVMARARDSPHVDELPDTMCFQERYEFVDWSCRMADGPENMGHGPIIS